MEKPFELEAVDGLVKREESGASEAVGPVKAGEEEVYDPGKRAICQVEPL